MTSAPPLRHADGVTSVADDSPDEPSLPAPPLVPESAILILLGAGLLGIAATMRRTLLKGPKSS